MKIPEFATHYYLPETGPFRSLSELSTGSEDPVFQDLLTRHQRDPGYRRRYGRNYISVRREVEARLRELFIARGGKARRRHPFYPVLGESPWFRDFNAHQRELKIRGGLLLTEQPTNTCYQSRPFKFYQWEIMVDVLRAATPTR